MSQPIPTIQDLTSHLLGEEWYRGLLEGLFSLRKKMCQGTEEYFVVDNWCLLQYFRYDETGTKQCLLKGNGSFDYDGYKILRDYLLNSRKQTNVRPLTISEFTSILENEGQFKVVPRKIKQS